MTTTENAFDARILINRGADLAGGGLIIHFTAMTLCAVLHWQRDVQQTIALANSATHGGPLPAVTHTALATRGHAVRMAGSGRPIRAARGLLWTIDGSRNRIAYYSCHSVQYPPTPISAHQHAVGGMGSQRPSTESQPHPVASLQESFNLEQI